MLTLLLLLGRCQNKVTFFLVDLLFLMYTKVFWHFKCFPLGFSRIMLFSYSKLNFELLYGLPYRSLYQYAFFYLNFLYSLFYLFSQQFLYHTIHLRFFLTLTVWQGAMVLITQSILVTECYSLYAMCGLSKFSQLRNQNLSWVSHQTSSE